MKSKVYLTINSRGGVKCTKNRQSCSWDEVSIGLNLELPDVLFKRPQIEASVTVDADKVQPFEISADTKNMVKDAIEQSTGLQVKLEIINPV